MGGAAELAPGSVAKTAAAAVAMNRNLFKFPSLVPDERIRVSRPCLKTSIGRTEPRCQVLQSRNSAAATDMAGAAHCGWNRNGKPSKVVMPAPAGGLSRVTGAAG